MNGAADLRRAAVSRVLSDAVRGAWAGDVERSRRLLRLADRLAGAEYRKELLVAAETVRGALPGGGESVVQDAVTGVPAGPAPRLRLPPGTDLRRLGAPQPVPPRGAEPVAPPRPPQTAVRARRCRGAGGVVVVLVALAAIGGVGWTAGGKPLPWDRAASARSLLGEGRAGEARERLVDAADSEGLALRGEAHLVLGDTVAAVVDLVEAARLDGVPGERAWVAATRLERLPGYESEAAEAFRLAYVAGVPRERWGRVAAALGRAGREEEAARVRAGVGR
jgi:hypothetical protein